MEGVLEFNEGHFNEMASGHGISENARKGAIDRVKMIQNHIKNKYVDAMEKHPMANYNSVEERNSAIKNELSFTGHDLEKIFNEKIINPVDNFGKIKYLQAEMGST